jgi:glucokinase
VIAAGELILARARRVVAERALALPAQHARVLAASFGAESGMVGAAVFARDRLGERVRA